MRRYNETVDVRLQQAGPVAFVWRERLYVVRQVLGCWRERQAWWSHHDRGALRAEDIGESRIWRVEAGSGRTTGPAAGVFDLCESMPLGVDEPVGAVGPRPQHWRLLRSLD